MPKSPPKNAPVLKKLEAEVVEKNIPQAHSVDDLPPAPPPVGLTKRKRNDQRRSVLQDHPSIKQIENELLCGKSRRSVALKYKINLITLMRYWRNNLQPRIQHFVEMRKEQALNDTGERISWAFEFSKREAEKAAEAERHSDAMGYLDRSLKTTELSATVRKEVGPASVATPPPAQTQFNLIMLPKIGDRIEELSSIPALPLLPGVVENEGVEGKGE